MKKKYTLAEIEIILVGQDIITLSGGIGTDDPIMGGDENEGNGIGGGYNPGGWT